MSMDIGVAIVVAAVILVLGPLLLAGAVVGGLLLLRWLDRLVWRNRRRRR